MNPVSARLLNQQLICPQFNTPHDAVAWFGAMQGQEYKMMRWAVGMWTKRPSVKAFENDYNSGRIVRAHFYFPMQKVSFFPRWCVGKLSISDY